MSKSLHRIATLYNILHPRRGKWSVYSIHHRTGNQVSKTILILQDRTCWWFAWWYSPDQSNNATGGYRTKSQTRMTTLLTHSRPTFRVAVRNSFTFFSNLSDATLQLWPNKFGAFPTQPCLVAASVTVEKVSQRGISTTAPRMLKSETRRRFLTWEQKGYWRLKCRSMLESPWPCPAAAHTVKLQYPWMTCSRAGPCSHPLQCPDAACSTSFTSEWAPWFQASIIQILFWENELRTRVRRSQQMQKKWPKKRPCYRPFLPWLANMDPFTCNGPL